MKFAAGKACGIVVTIESKDTVRVAQEGISNGYAIIRRGMVVGIKYPNSQPDNAPSIAELKRWEVTGELPTTCTASMDSFFTARKCDETDLIPTPLTARINDKDYLIYRRADFNRPVFVDSSLNALMALGDATQGEQTSSIIHVRLEGDIVAVIMPYEVEKDAKWNNVARLEWHELKDLED